MNKAQIVLSIFNESSDILNWKEINNLDGHRLGYVTIVYRDPKDKYVNLATSPYYALNSTGDGWFRVPKEEDMLTSGYGLMIRDLKLTSKNPFDDSEYHTDGFNKNYDVYKGMVTALPSSEDYDDGDVLKYETDPVWIILRKGVNFKDVLDYINKNKKNWIP